MKDIKDIESAEKRLTEICDALEGANLTISDGVKLYEEGSEIVKFLNSELNLVKGKIVKIKQTIDKIEEEDID
ncbi:MAG: exodeoxyribonuclease VII small subunit [Clostridia bacterium]|nr:exodeoxyribonuclease VII small subunit [Clostridia bacterium]